MKSMLSEEMLKQMQAEFNEEWGIEEEEDIVAEAPKETLLTVVAEMIDAYMEECINHFLATRSRNMEDDGRYFYSDEELKAFKDGYTSQGGDLDLLHIGVVPRDDGSFLCYEVCRKKYYDAQTYYAKNMLVDENGERRQIFFS